MSRLFGAAAEGSLQPTQALNCTPNPKPYLKPKSPTFLGLLTIMVSIYSSEKVGLFGTGTPYLGIQKPYRLRVLPLIEGSEPTIL